MRCSPNCHSERSAAELEESLIIKYSGSRDVSTAHNMTKGTANTQQLKSKRQFKDQA